tara:strand:+ start:2831 stop:4429 length:1599 start_codon:yes stop_codon:yes gene_type:complete
MISLSGNSGVKHFKSSTIIKGSCREKENVILYKNIGTTEVNSSSPVSVIERVIPRTPAKQRSCLARRPALSEISAKFFDDLEITDKVQIIRKIAKGAQKIAYLVRIKDKNVVALLGAFDKVNTIKEFSKITPVDEGGIYHPCRKLHGHYLLQEEGTVLFDLKFSRKWVDFIRQVSDVGFMAINMQGKQMVQKDLKLSNILDIGGIAARIDAPIGFDKTDLSDPSTLLNSRHLIGTPQFDSPLLLQFSLDEQAVWQEFLVSYLELFKPIKNFNQNELELEIQKLEQKRNFKVIELRNKLLDSLEVINMFSFGSIVLGGVLDVVSQLSSGVYTAFNQHWSMDSSLKSRYKNQLDSLEKSTCLNRKVFDQPLELKGLIKSLFNDESLTTIKHDKANYLEKANHAYKQSFRFYQKNLIHQHYQQLFLDNINNYKSNFNKQDFTSFVNSPEKAHVLKEVGLLALDAMAGKIRAIDFATRLRSFYEDSKDSLVVFNYETLVSKDLSSTRFACSKTQSVDSNDLSNRHGSCTPTEFVSN